jgi:hypothetical protein
MINKIKIDKTPRYCASPEELKAGDILIFNYNPASRHLDSGGFMTKYNQSFLNERGGHRTSVHAGFIVDTPSGKKLAHVVGKGFLLDDLTTNYLKRTVHVYRPRKYQNELGAELSKLINEHVVIPEKTILDEDISIEGILEPVYERHEQLHTFALNAKRKARKFKWDVTIGLRAMIHRIFLSLMIVNNNPDSMEADSEQNYPNDVISSNTICSKYVADSYRSACNRMTNSKDKKINYAKYFMNISALTPPKALQAYLYRNTNYDYLVMPHAAPRNNLDLYFELINVIQKEIKRLQKSIFTAAREKGGHLQSLITYFNNQEHSEDVLQRSINLLKLITPILKQNTGGDFVTPTSYRRVMAFAKNEGVYPDYIDFELHDRREGKIRDLAGQYYKLSPAMTKMYRNFRRIGYSDEEAKYESNPSFGEWYKLSPTRNILLTCSIIGFFAWVLPHGLRRTKLAKERNEMRESWQTILGKVRQPVPSNKIDGMGRERVTQVRL